VANYHRNTVGTIPKLVIDVSSMLTAGNCPAGDDMPESAFNEGCRGHSSDNTSANLDAKR